MVTTQSQILAVLTAFLIGPASTTRGALTVAQTIWINVHPTTELVLNCGNRTHTGVVQYWQTPFGQLRNHGNRGDLDPTLSMRSDGSLFAAKASVHHSGLYYCLLVAKGGTTLWPYQVNIGLHNSPDLQMAQGSSTKPGFRKDQVRSRHRRGLAGSGQKTGQAGVTDSAFAGAVAASVVLTFVVGFSAGALGRAYVLRCLGVVSGKIQSLRRGRPTGRGCQVTMTTLQVTDNGCVFYDDSDSARGETTLDTTCSSSSSPPRPPKPQRSFRHKSGEQPGPAAPLEGRDPAEEEVQRRRDGQEEKEVEERMKERKEGEPEEEYVEERVKARMTEERRESRDEEKEMEERRESRDDEGEMEERRESRDEGNREGETDEKEVEQRMKERKEREPEEVYVEERVEARMTERRESRDKEREMEERRESREEGNREGETDEKEVEERMKERSRVVEQLIEERRDIREGEAGVTGENKVGGDRSPMVTITEGSSEAGGRGGTGRKSKGMAEGKEAVVEEQMETASAREECQKEGGAVDHGEVSSEDENSDSSSDTQDEGKREKREEGREQVNKNDKGAEEGTAKSGVARGRRSRVIRLYQYDDEGHRYSHLPSPASSELDPTPRLKQRSLSLTRLSAIMAAATASPLTPPGGGTGREEHCPSPPFSPAPFFKMDL